MAELSPSLSVNSLILNAYKSKVKMKRFEGWLKSSASIYYPQETQFRYTHTHTQKLKVKNSKTDSCQIVTRSATDWLYLCVEKSGLRKITGDKGHYIEKTFTVLRR